MAFRKNNIVIILLTIAMVGFVLGTFGVPHLGMTMSMDTDGHMTMSNCLMPGMTAVCDMTPLEHIASWQSMFTISLFQYSSDLLLLLIAFAISWYLSYWLYKPIERLGFLSRYRYRETVFDSLRLAIAAGIIHSKAY